MGFQRLSAAVLTIPFLLLGQWSEPQIRNMVTDSPWAKQAKVSIRGQIDSSFDSRRGAGGAEDPNPVEAGAPIVVRWDSALPVREACAAGGLERYLFSCYSKLLSLSDQSRKFAELAKSFYIITVADFPGNMAPARARYAPQHSDAANAALTEMGQRLQRGTALRRKGKDPFRPDRVLVLPAGRDFLVVAFFSRLEHIGPEEKTVTFEMDDGSIDIQARFDLRKMSYKGTLAL